MYKIFFNSFKLDSIAKHTLIYLLHIDQELTCPTKFENTSY